MTKNETQSWFKSNALSLTLSFAGAITAFAILRVTVIAQGKEIDTLKFKTDAYPSEKYFDLRFKTQDDKLDDLEGKIDSLSSDLKKHIEK